MDTLLRADALVDRPCLLTGGAVSRAKVSGVVRLGSFVARLFLGRPLPRLITAEGESCVLVISKGRPGLGASAKFLIEAERVSRPVAGIELPIKSKAVLLVNY